VFGPVPSRRLGRSLGIDLVPFKTCTYDCIYCQLGRTTNRTVERRRYIAAADVMRRVERALKTAGRVDYLTLSGSGEPTLHAGAGALVTALKREFGKPVAVLTNGALLGNPAVADALLPADVVMPTLAADSETTYQCVHRPHPSLHFDTFVKGLQDFAAAYHNHLWLEVFLLDGITALEQTVASMKRVVDTLRPERVQVNTATRPPVEDFAFAAPDRRLASLARLLGPTAEVITEYRHATPRRAGARKDATQEILTLLRRRPCTHRDVADALSLHRVEALKLLDGLAEQGRIAVQQRDGAEFYTTASRRRAE